MNLTSHTDYALRVLLYLRVTGRVTTVDEMARGYEISKNHLQKVVRTLVQAGFVSSTRGRGGGVALARPPEQINLRAVVEAAEPHLDLVECFDPATNTCPIAGPCSLTAVLREAQEKFLAHLAGFTLRDVGRATGPLKERLRIPG